MGTEYDVKKNSLSKKGRRDVVWVFAREQRDLRSLHRKKKFLSEFIAVRMWRSLGKICEKRANAFFRHLITYFRLEEYLLVENHGSLQYDEGLRQSHKMEAQVEVA